MKIVLLMSLWVLVGGLLQINRIEDNSGYTIIQVRKVEIANVTNTVLHIVHPMDILNMIEMIGTNVEKIDVDNKEILRKEVSVIKAKIKTIMPFQSNRTKRGLINGVGTVYKWLFGLMDDNDREEILEHLKYAEINEHNVINTINKQVTINSHFNDSLKTLKEIIESDRNKIDKSIEEFWTRNSGTSKKILFLDQMLKLKNLEGKITQIQESIASVKNNIIHPGILTPEEIENFRIDYYKLKLIKMGVMTYRDNSLIIAMKIPTNFLVTDLKLITPLPNDKYLEIDEENELIVTLNNITYKYKENAFSNDFKISKNCVLAKNCKSRFNNVTTIDAIDDDLILIKNANNIKLTQDCDNRNIIMNKNYLINFYNCKLQILNKNLVNKKIVVDEKFSYPNNDLTNVVFNEKIDFEEIKFNQIENIKQIEELIYHKNVSYSINAILILSIIIVFLLIVLYKKCCKRNENVNVNIELKSNTTRLRDTVESGTIKPIWEMK